MLPQNNTRGQDAILQYLNYNAVTVLLVCVATPRPPVRSHVSGNSTLLDLILMAVLSMYKHA